MRANKFLSEVFQSNLIFASPVAGLRPRDRHSSMYTVYVLRSEKDKNLYIGCTSDLEKRLASHTAGRVSSTKYRLPMKLIFFEKFEDKHEAFFTERFYKTAKGKRELLAKL